MLAQSNPDGNIYLLEHKQASLLAVKKETDGIDVRSNDARRRKIQYELLLELTSIFFFFFFAKTSTYIQNCAFIYRYCIL